MKRSLTLLFALSSVAAFGAASDTFESRLELYKQAVQSGDFERIFDRHAALRELDKNKACQASRNDETLLQLIVDRQPEQREEFLPLFATSRVHAYHNAISRKNWGFFTGILEQKKLEQDAAKQKKAEQEQAEHKQAELDRAAQQAATEERQRLSHIKLAKENLLNLFCVYQTVTENSDRSEVMQQILTSTTQLYIAIGKEAYHEFVEQEAFTAFADTVIANQDRSALEELAKNLNPESDVNDKIVKAFYALQGGFLPKQYATHQATSSQNHAATSGQNQPAAASSSSSSTPDDQDAEARAEQAAQLDRQINDLIGLYTLCENDQQQKLEVVRNVAECLQILTTLEQEGEKTLAIIFKDSEFTTFSEQVNADGNQGPLRELNAMLGNDNTEQAALPVIPVENNFGNAHQFSDAEQNVAQFQEQEDNDQLQLALAMSQSEIPVPQEAAPQADAVIAPDAAPAELAVVPAEEVVEAPTIAENNQVDQAPAELAVVPAEEVIEAPTVAENNQVGQAPAEIRTQNTRTRLAIGILASASIIALGAYLFNKYCSQQ